MNLNGFLLVDKPAGPSSAGVVGRLKWLLKNHLGAPKNIKIGHGGTLDPFATGLLPIGIGKATKQLQTLLDGPKTYTFTLELGTATTTGDPKGEVSATAPVPAAWQARLPEAIQGLTGEITQTPPAFSALKVGGKRAYALARAGEVVELAPRSVTIYTLDILNAAENQLECSASVSKGTYIRVLGEDLAKALGTVGHLSTLRRTAHGGFDISQTHTLETLDSAIQNGQLGPYLLPLDAPPAGKDE